MTSFHPSILVSLISKSVPERVFEKAVVDPLSEFARKNLNSIQEELKGLSLNDLELCAERFESLSQDLDDEVANALNELVLEELNMREDKPLESTVPSAAQRELSQFLSLEQELEKWVEDPKVSGEKGVAAERIRNAFLEDSRTLDLSGLGLNNLPGSLLDFQNLRELKLYKNAFSGGFLYELKHVLRDHGIRLVHQEHFTGKDSARHPVKASSLRHVDPQTYKSLEERRREKVGQTWDCLECKPDSYGGFRYKFSLKPEFLGSDGNVDEKKFEQKQEEIFPAIEPNPDNLEGLLKMAFKNDSDRIDLGFEYGGEDGGFFVWIPDVEALTARYAALREAQPERGLIEHLGIVRSDGIASDLDFVEALITNNGLVSDSLEFFHDMTIHTLQLLSPLLPSKDSGLNTALLKDWKSLQELLPEFSLPDLDLSKRESLLTATNTLRSILQSHYGRLEDLGLLQQVAETFAELGKRAESLYSYVHARRPYAAGIAQSWGKLLLLKEKLAGGMKNIPLENQAKVKDLIEFIETSLGAVTDLDSVNSTSYSSLEKASFSQLWDNPFWIAYANRRYGEKADEAYQQLVEDLEQAWEGVERFVALWKAPAILKQFVEHDLTDWENDPEVKGDKSEAAKRIRLSLDQAEDGLPATELDLSNLGLSALPEGFAKLTHLTSLNLSGNQLDSIPQSIKKLPELEELDLSNNQIKHPERRSDVIESKHLQRFDISNNKYGTFDDLWLLSKNIRHLNFSCNNAKGTFMWANYVPYWKELEVLDISGNQFSNIKGGFFGWKAASSLKTIRLSGCPLDDLSFLKEDFIDWADQNDIQLEF